jgi:hypothetical protein
MGSDTLETPRGNTNPNKPNKGKIKKELREKYPISSYPGWTDRVIDSVADNEVCKKVEYKTIKKVER